MQIASVVHKLLSSLRRKVARSGGVRVSLARYLVSLMVVSFFGTTAHAQAEVELIANGEPLWEVQAFGRVVVPVAGTSGNAINREVRQLATDVLGTLHGDEFTPGVPHERPYDNEFRHALAEAGHINTDTFLSHEIRLPNIVMKPFVIVPTEDAPLGPSHDFENGPVLPEEIFPIERNFWVNLNGVKLGERTRVLIHDNVDGDRSHQPAIMWTGRTPSEPTVGEWEWIEVLTDATGNGWTIIDTFDVVARATRTPGDLNYNGELDLADLNILTSNIAVAPASEDAALASRRAFQTLDFNGDQAFDTQDVHSWVSDLKGTSPGDADLNGDVDFADFLALSENFNGPGNWSQGDFDARAVRQKPPPAARTRRDRRTPRRHLRRGRPRRPPTASLRTGPARRHLPREDDAPPARPPRLCQGPHDARPQVQVHLLPRGVRRTLRPRGRSGRAREPGAKEGDAARGQTNARPPAVLVPDHGRRRAAREGSAGFLRPAQARGQVGTEVRPCRYP